MDRFEARHVQVLGVSHNGVATHARFHAKLGLAYPLLSDPPGAVAKQYGAKGLLPLFKRRAVVIDGRGVVRLVVDGMPDVEALLTFVDGLAGDLPGS